MQEQTHSILAPLRLKLLFWLILTVFSVFFAEVVSGSYPMPFTDAWGLFMVLPLYGLHLLVLAALVKSRPRLTTLFLAGALFGMYEAYITKVLWSPTWGTEFAALTWGGIYVVQIAILVLFWHPLMAFMLPLYSADSLFLKHSSLSALLPVFIQNILRSPTRRSLVLVGFVSYCALYHSTNAVSRQAALVSGIINMAVLFTLGWLWKRFNPNNLYTLEDLLPSRQQTILLSFFLLCLYIWAGFALRPAELPRQLGPHLTVLGIYILLVLLLIRSYRDPMEIYVPRLALPDSKATLFFAGVYIFGSVLLVPAKSVTWVVVLLSWIMGCGIGSWIILRAALTTQKQHSVKNITDHP